MESARFDYEQEVSEHEAVNDDKSKIMEENLKLQGINLQLKQDKAKVKNKLESTENLKKENEVSELKKRILIQ